MHNVKKILVADDEKIILKVLKEELNEVGYIVDTVNNGKEAIDKIIKFDYDLVILDNKMPKMDGIDVLRYINQHNINLIVIMMTAFGTINNAVNAMKLGAFDYITKPFENDELISKIKLAFDKTEEVLNNPESSKIINSFIGKSSEYLKVKETIERVKNINSTILLTGESGTGKGVVAREIHYKGNRKTKPFIHINCAVLPVNLIESELFGHIKGSFTGAINDKKGKFELAEDGTIFLDEIGLLDHNLQAKLLTVLQEKRYEKIGSGKTQILRARIIAATNEKLEEQVRKGNFRKDLYYRLNVISINCPSLRVRKEDIEMLTLHFVDKFNKLHKRNVKYIDKGLWNILKSYDWPGNIRELENFVERVVAMNIKDRIDLEDVPPRFFNTKMTSNSNIVKDNKLSLEKQEYYAIVEALNRNGGHREKTANELGISRRTLQYKLKKYKLK